MGETIDTKSTDDVAKHRQVEYWNEVISDTFTSLEAIPAESNKLDARLQKAQISSLGLSEVQSSPARVSHLKSQISRETNPLFLVHLQLQGSSVNKQDGREAVLNTGDYTLCDSTRPYDLSFNDNNNMLVLRIPADILKTVLKAPEDLTCISMSGQQGMSAVTSSMLSQIWKSRQDSWNVIQQRKLAQIILDTIAVSYAEICEQRAPETSVQHSRRIRIVTFIENHLENPGLTPQSIADAFGITPRYLHQLFKGMGETVAQYILRRRLDRAKTNLEDIVCRGKTISEIAYALGFNNMTHFGRVFKEKYGIAPRDAR